MSNSAYIEMQTPKRGGLRNVGDPVYNGPDYRGMIEEGSVVGFAKKLALGPFMAVDKLFGLRTLASLGLSFMGSMIYGLVFVYAQSNSVTTSLATSAPTSPAFEAFLRTFVLAVISAAVYWVTTIWTFFDDMPTIIYPAHAFSLIATSLTRSKDKTFGFVLALCYAAVIISGYAAAGGILKALAVTGQYQNIAVSTNSLHMYWFGATIIAFSFLYNRVFAQDDETTRGTQTRSSTATAIAIFAMMMTFSGLGLNSFTCGLYLTQIIVSGNTFPVNGSGWNEIAYFFCVDLLAVAASTFAIVALFGLLFYYANGGKSIPSSKRLAEDQQPLMETHINASIPNVASNVSSSTRVNQRAKLNVQY